MFRRLLDTIFSAGLFLAAIWFWIIANEFPNSPRYAQIDTDFWPKIIFGVMALLTGCITVQNIMKLMRRSASDFDEPAAVTDWGTILRMSAMGLLVFVYFIAFGRIGFVISTVVFLWIAAFMLPSGKPWVKAIFSPILTAALTVVFAYLLELPLPRGTGPFYNLSLLIY